MKAILAIVIVVAIPAVAHAADAEGCKDSPLIGRFPGSELVACSDKADDVVTFPQQKQFEGEVHHATYSFPAAAGRVAVYRNLKTALVKAGFEIPYDTSPENGDFLAHSGKNWIFVEGHSSTYSQTVFVEVKLEQVVTANPAGHYGPLAQSAAAGVDAAGCADSPFVTRFPKSVLKSCADKPDDVAKLPVGTDQKQIEGEIHELTYVYPPSSSKAQVYRNLKTALEQAGFSFAFDTSPDVGDFVARSGRNWIYEEVSGGGGYRQTVVIETRLAQEVTANADAMYGDLSRNGHAAVYGILFDTGKAEIKPSSAAALKEIVKLLKKEPTLKLYVVGHTDHVGDVTSNLELSRRRAAAVVHALVTEYGIAPGILDSFGAGPYSPVSTNDKEEGGRALNRRVELVKQ